MSSSTELNTAALKNEHIEHNVSTVSNRENKQGTEKHDGDGVIISQKRVDPNSSFYATFIDGSSFRNMIEYLRLPSTEGVFRFTKTSIVYEQGDRDNNILNVVKLKTYELTDYEFSSKSDEIVIGINLSEIRNVCRNVGKKDQIDLYKLATEPRNLYFRVRSQSEKGSEPTIYLIPITTIEYNTYKLPSYRRGKTDPTCTVYQCDFSKLCKSLVVTKCSHAMVHGFEKGIIFKGILINGTIGSVKEFGRCNSNTEPTEHNLKSAYPVQDGTIIKAKKAPPRLNIGVVGEIEKYKIDISIVKYLIKLNALNPVGTIKMYIEKGIPLKMVCNIGSFGKLSIYIAG
jgi:hypothetical protein